MRTEQDLRAALQEAAARAVDPADIADAVRVRRRRRTHRRHQAALASAVVVIVVAGGSAVLRGGGGGSTDAGTTAAPTTHATTASPASAPPSAGPAGPDLRKFLPARTVWPDAVFTIPAEAPDGSGYSPLTALSPTELLMIARTKFSKIDRLDVYDTGTGESRVITRMPASKKDYHQWRFEVGADYIGWYGTMLNGRKGGWADFWVAPRAGGAAIKVGEVTGDLSGVSAIGVSSDSFVWSIRPGGVYRMPITGGSPEKLAGTDGLWLQSWPWAVDVPPIRIGQVQDRNQSKLVNLETGETRTIIPPAGVKGLGCSIEWCLGRMGNAVIVMRPDGSGLSRIPVPSSYLLPPLGSHFAQMSGAVVYDLNTGKKAIVGVRPVGYSWRATSSSPLLSWEAGRGKLDVLNLLAVDG
ncbi:hypothetical protein Psi02_53580 [Planotetraspora silvatica]|uniref:Uncharacterized protein n=1 Tax=Planotetraspora silvatica TaxID=234614 RepID=A0A8J3XPZ9_9ACTN|nr:hypothetical protein [Planotetraspora silvatica]GII48934.1 hypothetical protein Psi02_53580 [Planotetraspora silvatica]